MQPCLAFRAQSPHDMSKMEFRKHVEDLFWNDAYTYFGLCEYCNTSKVDEITKHILITKGFIDQEGNIPTRLREVVYETTTGFAVPY